MSQWPQSPLPIVSKHLYNIYNDYFEMITNGLAAVKNNYTDSDLALHNCSLKSVVLREYNAVMQFTAKTSTQQIIY